MDKQNRDRGQGISEARLGRLDRREGGDGRREGAEEDRGKKEPAAAGESAPKDVALDAAIQVAEVSQSAAGFVEGERGPWALVGVLTPVPAPGRREGTFSAGHL
jgi:hypothetical protein